MRKNRLRWLGYVLRREETDTVRLVKGIYVERKRERGRPKKRWLTPNHLFLGSQRTRMIERGMV